MFSNSSNSSTTQTLPPAVPRFLPKDNVGPIGLEVRDGDLAFTVASFQCGATQVSNGTVNRLAQGKYCFMAIDMTNTGRNPATFLLPSQMLNDDQKRMFGPDLAATAAYPDNTGRDLGALVINPGNKVHGVVVYDIPQAEAPTYVNLHAGPTGSGAYVGPLPAS
jgi:hypothetical protein